MFVMCQQMKWNHLPVAGGIYDQHPDLIAGFEVIFDAIARHEAEEQRKQDAESRRASRGGGKRPGPSARGPR